MGGLTEGGHRTEVKFAMSSCLVESGVSDWGLRFVTCRLPWRQPTPTRQDRVLRQTGCDCDRLEVSILASPTIPCFR